MKECLDKIMEKHLPGLRGFNKTELRINLMLYEMLKSCTKQIEETEKTKEGYPEGSSNG
jgi:hypothetical protein